ncbi:hypothetical protein L208DRAFT_1402063 [Tricholoma matsutake]|nr:hypothetical protein L208DRAFT_1402063 [Tricholoma matsutake 945]
MSFKLVWCVRIRSPKWPQPRFKARAKAQDFGQGPIPDVPIFDPGQQCKYYLSVLVSNEPRSSYAGHVLVDIDVRVLQP